MARENKTKYAILGILNLKPASGYDIKKYADSSINHFWSENYGHIYPVLRQLEQEGLAVKEPDIGGGKLPRHVYTITEAGRQALTDWLRVPPEQPQARHEFLLKLFFGSNVPTEVTLNRMAESRVFCLQMLADYAVIEETIRLCMAEKPEEARRIGFQLLTVRYGIRTMQATVDWLDEVIASLEDMNGV